MHRENKAGKSESSKNRFGYFSGSIEELIENSRNDGGKLIKKVVSPVSQKLIDILKGSSVEVTSDYVHTIDNFAIKHTLSKHGSNQEIHRGQIPVKSDDFQRIREIVEEYDNLEVSRNYRGQNIIRYCKSFLDGNTFFVEEIRVNRKELAMATMYKKRLSITNDILPIKPVSLTPEATLDFTQSLDIKDTKNSNNP